MSKTAVRYLRNPETIRQHASQILASVEAGQGFFSYHPEQLEAVTKYVKELTGERYPDFRIPLHSRWLHFDSGGRKRISQLRQALKKLDPREEARRLCELVTVSVFLDAGAGPLWTYLEPSGVHLQRSEGLAVASLNMFEAGLFAIDKRPFRVDAGGLLAIDKKTLASGMQVTSNNPLKGFDGRLAILRRLGHLIMQRSDVFADAKLGSFVDYIDNISQKTGGIRAADLLQAVLDVFSPILPSSLSIDDTPMGDIGFHPAVKGPHDTMGLIPFHKLVQWFCYSLVAPLKHAGITVTALDQLTPLAEYRNGGLLLDSGLIRLRCPDLASASHALSNAVITEWRALTICLIDKIGESMRRQLGLSSAELSTCQVLQGGTWEAGRRLAFARRAQGDPPLHLELTGDIF